VSDAPESLPKTFWPPRRVVLTGMVLALAAGALFTAMALVERADDKASAAGWDVSGPACPRINQDWYARLRIDRPTPFSFEAIRGSFAYGSASCTEINVADGRPTKPYPVCELSSPFVIHLTGARAELYFEPGVGRPVTLSLRDGEARCVMGAKI
jgi:hypothetical protein